MYDVLLPSFIAGFAAFTTTQFLGVEYTYYDVRFYQQIALDIPLILQVVVAGIFFGVVADILVTTLRKTSKLVKKLKYSPYTKAFVGGLILVALTLIFGERYLGLGMDTIKDALSPSYGDGASTAIPWYAFLLKTIFTSITLGVGGSGGIITPVFYIGATSGNWFGHIVGGEHVALFAALGFVSVVSGAANAPIAATIMAVELFGLEIAHYAAISAIISFLLTGHRSVFSSQKLGMRKSDILDIQLGDDIDSASVSLDTKEKNKIQNLQDRLREKKEALYTRKTPRK
jgi:H+/Cl- antiporter ClcA